MSKVRFYLDERPDRKNRIVKWYFESASITKNTMALRTYLETGDISFFENIIENHIEPAFSYIIEYGVINDFARRCIRHLNLSKRPKKRYVEPIVKFGYSKGRRVKISRFSQIKYKSGKIVIRARDKKGRFVKVQ